MLSDNKDTIINVHPSCRCQQILADNKDTIINVHPSCRCQQILADNKDTIINVHPSCRYSLGLPIFTCLLTCYITSVWNNNNKYPTHWTHKHAHWM